jgi:hypothetical protein
MYNPFLTSYKYPQLIPGNWRVGVERKKGEREKNRRGRESITNTQQERLQKWLGSPSRFLAFQLNSADMSDVLGHGTLNISGQVSVEQQKPLISLAFFSTSLLLRIPTMFKLIENLQAQDILCLHNSI